MTSRAERRAAQRLARSMGGHVVAIHEDGSVEVCGEPGCSQSVVTGDEGQGRTARAEPEDRPRRSSPGASLWRSRPAWGL